MYQQRSGGTHFLIGRVLCLFVVVFFWGGGGIERKHHIQGVGAGAGDSPSETFEI